MVKRSVPSDTVDFHFKTTNAIMYCLWNNTHTHTQVVRQTLRRMIPTKFIILPVGRKGTALLSVMFNFFYLEEMVGRSLFPALGWKASLLEYISPPKLLTSLRWLSLFRYRQLLESKECMTLMLPANLVLTVRKDLVLGLPETLVNAVRMKFINLFNFQHPFLYFYISVLYFSLLFKLH